MIGHAEGRALGWGRLRVKLAATLDGHAAGTADTSGQLGATSVGGMVGLGRVPAHAVGRLGDLSCTDLLGLASGAAQAGARLGMVTMPPIFGRASIAVPAFVSGSVGGLRVRQLAGGHRLGSSVAGAGFTTVVRVAGTHPVVEYDSQGPTNSDTISVVPVVWLDTLVSNVGTSTLYLMFFDATSPPSNGTLPNRQPTQVPAGGQVYVDLGDPGAADMSGKATKTGLVWAASTTATTLTLDSTSSLWVTTRSTIIGS